MQGRQDIARPRPGYCLAELLLVIALIGICLLAATVCIRDGVDRQQARGVAQVAQAAVARAQASAIWLGGEARVSLARGHVIVDRGLDSATDDLGLLAPAAVISVNVNRWKTLDGVLFRFLAPFGTPDSGGSIGIEGGGASYRVSVRPESGLTARSWSAR